MSNKFGKRIFLSAFGIHMGGGLVLLRSLAESIKSSVYISLLDARLCNREYAKEFYGKTIYIKRNLISRVYNLNFISKEMNSDDILICFNSLPPLRKPLGKVILFVQAAYLLGLCRNVKYNFITKLKMTVEKLWFMYGIGNCSEIWVQTESMAEYFRSNYPNSILKILPLVDEKILNLKNNEKVSNLEKEFSFIFPADAMKHKNHENLFSAWDILRKMGLEPRLYVTLNEYDFKILMKKFQNKRINIVNLGFLDREMLFEKYLMVSALIFPSLAESFGLPLVEASLLKIPIVASELDYVRDVCTPAQTFDPNSPRSIAMAIRRHMGFENKIEYVGIDYFSKSVHENNAIE